jgi:ABC-2 type transport system ATP-binding protein
MEYAIFTENLRKTYEGREVVKGIAVAVKPGEIFGFLGPNGAGKTTSIKMMIGELPPDEGRISIMGHTIPDAREEVKKIMGVVPDHQNLYDRLTVRQNLDLFCRLYDIGSERVDELIRLVDLVEHADVATIKLSRGQRQRTLIARGLIHSPKVFFLDEPTSALDPHSALGIRKVIENLRDHGTTIFITTHYMEEADQMCDRIAIMHHGKIVATDTPENLKLQFGKPVITVTVKEPDGSVKELELPLGAGAIEPLSPYLQENRVLKIHSREATLEEVFLNVTGDQWVNHEKLALGGNP